MIKIAALSDTHEDHKKVVFNEKHLQADLLIFGGDFSAKFANQEDVQEFLVWFAGQPQKYKIMIGGNHDFFAEENEDKLRSMLPPGVIYLNNESVEIEGYKIFGSPNTPNMPMWAFSKMEDKMNQFYDKIPADTQILITHSPPFGILDKSSRGINCGSSTLLEKIGSLQLKANIFGHVHNASGVIELDGVTYANVSVFNGEEPKYIEVE